MTLADWTIGRHAFVTIGGGMKNAHRSIRQRVRPNS